jgi:uroporphyrinogen decarboxylase
LSAGVSLYEYFGLEPFVFRPVGVDTLLYPPFEERVLEETADFVIKVTRRGVTVRDRRDEGSMPEFLAYPITGPGDLAWLRERLDPAHPGRVAPDWLAEAERGRADGAVQFCNGGTYFAFLNEHMGTETLLTTYFDDPGFIHAVNDLLCRACEAALQRILPVYPLEALAYHEDMAFKNGPLISPAMFREFMTPYYRRIQALAEPAGIDLGVMDSDGDIRQLIPLWLECGINVFTPMEVAAGMDVVAVRREYGKTACFWGGFDKRILAAGPAEITAELERLRPVIEDGGFIPGCDHLVPPDVSFANYSHFIRSLMSLYGMA